MWPWEHVIVGYVAYSLFRHLVFQQAPTGRETLAVVFASLLPDLIDKPLAWQFGVLSSGTSLAHSVFVAIPLVVLVYGLAQEFDRPAVGSAFGIGYLLHLPADILYVGLYGADIDWSGLLWPLVSSPPPAQQPGFLENVAYYFGNFSALFASEMGMTFLALEVSLVGGALALWLLDGVPGIRDRQPPRRRTPSRN